MREKQLYNPHQRSAGWHRSIDGTDEEAGEESRGGNFRGREAKKVSEAGESTC